MKLIEKLKLDLRESLKKKDLKKASILRIVLSSIKYYEIEKRTPPSDSNVVAILKSEVKKIKDSISEFSKAGREDLVKKEENDLLILQKYIPAQISEEEVRKIVKDTFLKIPPNEREFGKVMGTIMKKYRNKVDGAVVRKVVQEELNGN